MNIHLGRRFFPLVALIVLTVFPAVGQEMEGSLDVPNLSLLEKERQLRAELEKKIQADILDPILGRGKAMVFVSIELDIVTTREKVVQSGLGVASKTQSPNASKAFSETEYILPGIPKPKSFEAPTAAEGKSQQSKQEKGATQEKTSQKTMVRRLEVVVFHDDKLTKDVLDLVKTRMVDALRQFAIKPQQILFKPTPMKGKVTDDLRQPIVYVPAAFAFILFLFLLFLFGPLASFMRGYVRLIEKKEGMQVNVESEFKPPEGDGKGGPGGGGGGGIGAMEGEMSKTEEELGGGEDQMQKFEPFKYINEENVKGLIYLLKREEPWVISVVLTYLKGEFAQKVLSSLPVELQARVAMETAIIREVTREQVTAIDQQIKERVDFVIGGIEPLYRMLEEAAPEVRESVLEYLKNEKPEVFEKLRKRLLLFEDMPSIPDKSLSQVLRELKPSEIAVALKGSTPEIEAKIFANLSSGAVSLVKEEMELLSEISPEEVDKERSRILTIIKRLETEGKISFREKPQATLIEGVEEDEAKAREREATIKGLAAVPGRSEALGSQPQPQNEPAPSPEDYYNWGSGLYDQGSYGEAVEALLQAVGLRPDYWEAYQALGNAYYALGKFSEALDCYERVLQINPSKELEEFTASIRTQVHAG